MSELRKSGDGSLTLGLLPKISIDSKVRCPCEFTAEFPSPEPPDGRFPTLALELAGKTMIAIWPYRQYVEVIKIYFTLAEFSPHILNVCAEIIIDVPVTGEKIKVGKSAAIGFPLEPNLLTLGQTFTNLAENLSKQARKTVANNQTKVLNYHIYELQKFQDAFVADK